MSDPSAGLPDWLEPLREKAATLRSEDLSSFTPPAEPVPREGAVLVLFGEGPQGPDLLLTERGHAMRSQPGHVSFPGGSLDPGESVEDAALREAMEETGLDPEAAEVFAVLPRIWLPPRNFAVSPVLAFWRTPGPVGVVDPIEVHAVFREPIARLLDPANRFTVRHPLGRLGPAWMIGPERDVLLWGFTAGIIDAIFDHVGWTRPWDSTNVRDLPEQLVDWRGLSELVDSGVLGADLHAAATEAIKARTAQPGVEAGRDRRDGRRP